MSGISLRQFCKFKTQGGGDFEFWIINFESFLSLEIDFKILDSFFTL